MAVGLLLASAVVSDARAEIPHLDQITPGELRGIDRDPGDPWGYGYWEYLPTDFDLLGPDDTLPLLVFLAGIGEYDDDPSCPGNVDLCAPADCVVNDGLCRNLTWGPQQHIDDGNWDDVQRPFIVISPQHPVPPFTNGEWNIANLDAFIQFLLDNYPIDPQRIYLTGMSQGGRGTLQYVAAHPRRFTAAAPMPGGVVQAAASCAFEDTAFWAFHGEDDQNGNLGAGTFNPCAMVELVRMYDVPEDYPQYPACAARVGQPHPDARMTMFFDVGHFAWVQATDPVGSGFPAAEWPSDQGCGITTDFRAYEAALDPDGVYSWFLSLDRPIVVAPDDVVLPGDTMATSLLATAIDDDAIDWTWTQVSGPAATLVVADQATLELDDLLPEQQYTFEVLGVDADGQWDRDEVTVTLLEAPIGGSTDDGGTTGVDPSAGTTDDGGSTGTDGGTTDPSTTDGGTTDPSTTDGGTTEPSTTDGGTTDPSGTTDGGTTDPSGTTGGTTDPSTTDGGTTGTTASTESTGESTGLVDTGDGTSSTETSGSSSSDTTTGPTGDGSSDGTTTTAADTSGPADSGGSSATGTASGGSATAGSATAGSADDSGDSSGGDTAQDGGGGCGCDAGDPRRDRTGAAWTVLLLLLAMPRTRRRRSA